MTAEAPSYDGATPDGPTPAFPPYPHSVWERPRRLGYQETLRGLGGVVAPLLVGFSLATIALLVTSKDKPFLSAWAELAFGVTVVMLLLSMQSAFLALARDPSPDALSTWVPQTTVSPEALEMARKEQVATYKNMERFWNLSSNAYDIGMWSFLTGLLLLLIPHAHSWSVAHVLAVAVVFLALLNELWWDFGNRFTPGFRVFREVRLKRFRVIPEVRLKRGFPKHPAFRNLASWKDVKFNQDDDPAIYAYPAMYVSKLDSEQITWRWPDRPELDRQGGFARNAFRTAGAVLRARDSSGRRRKVSRGG